MSGPWPPRRTSRVVDSGCRLLPARSLDFLGVGHECQRQAPARWPATLLRGGVLRVTTWSATPSGVGKRGIPGYVPEVLGPRETHRVDRQPPHRPHVPPPSPAARRAGCRRHRLPSPPPRHLRAAHRHCDAGAARPASRWCAPSSCPTLSGDLVDYANLDHAASTPAFERVARAVEAATRTYSSRAPRHRLALPGHERALRGGARRGRPLRRRPTGRRRRLHPQHHRCRQPPRPLPAAGHLGRRLRLRAPRDAAAVGAAATPCGCPVPGQRARRRGAARGGAARPCRPAPPAVRARRSSCSPPPRTSPGSSGPWTASPPSPAATGPGCCWTPPSTPPTAPSTSARSTSTGSPSPGTRCTRRSAPGCSPGRQRLARRGPAVPRRRGRHGRRSPSAAPAGSAGRLGTRPVAPTCSAPSPSRPRARRSASTGPPSRSTRPG